MWPAKAFICPPCLIWASLDGSDGKESAYSTGNPGSIPGSERPLEKGMATQTSILVWRIPWTEASDVLQSMRLQHVRHD